MSDPQHPADSEIKPPSRTGLGLYSVHGIVIGTMICSLAATIYMLFMNYRALGNQNLARKVAVGGSAAYLILIGIFSQFPPSLTLALSAMMIQGAIAYFLTATLQGPSIRYHQQNGGLIYSTARAVAVSLITGFVLLFLAMTLLAVIGTLTGTLPVPPEQSGLAT